MNRKEDRNRLYHYSIRKTTLGVGSVVVALFLAGAFVPAQSVSAEEVETSLAGAEVTSLENEEMEAFSIDGGSSASVSVEEGEAPVAVSNLTVAREEAAEDAVVETHPAVEDGRIELGNEETSRHFVIQDGRLRTEAIENKISKERLVFEEGSKEFTIQFKPGAEDPAAPTMPAYVPESTDRNEWQARTNSEADAGADEGRLRLALDGNLTSRWHNRYDSRGDGTQSNLPVYAEFTFHQPKDIRTFIYVPRQDGAENGLIKDYTLYIKQNGATDYTEVKQGAITDNPRGIQLLDLGELKTQVSSIKFEARSAHNRQPFAAAAEFDLSSDSPEVIRARQAARQAAYIKELEAYQSGFQISLDKLTLAEKGISRKVSSEGETLTFTFKPHVYKGVPVTIKYVVDLKKDAKFSQAHLLLSVPEAQKDSLTIDSIDLQSYRLKDGQTYEEFSKQANIAEMSGFNGFYAGLGQPVYIGSFYTGSEFPLAWNSVEATGKTLFSRYYSGKTFGQLDRDKEGNIRTWNTVFGVARSSDYQVVQQDFYAYLAKIGQDTYFRKQYNSWFDHMKDITADNIQSSFNEIERGFTNGGISPLHSYVVDDGWQTVASLWEFNAKFPNKLYDSSKQVKRFGSDFGLWLGPQGGYGNPHVMADYLVSSGKGSKHGNVVYIGDKRYTDGLTKIFENYDKEFDINYWKLDGLLLQPKGTTDEYGIGGGYRNMYSMTETHERWIKLYETIRKHATDPEKMWINLTSYIPPSPWYLQWVNSIWMQNAGDVDYQDGVKKQEYSHLDFGNDAAEAITYRDDRYEELVKLRKWQLPFANIYNHDPVYGNTAHSSKRLQPGGPARPKINFSTDDLRTYLYMLGTRGTGFWEFYYSASMMDEEKWQVNGEAVQWIESNYETLKHAVFHGGKPGHGEVYGYSAWDENKGIVSIRNPINAEADYTVTLDRLVGMREGTLRMVRTTVLGDKRHDTTTLTNYGDRLSIHLKPYETVVFEYSKVADQTPAKVVKAKANTAREIVLQFDERILLDEETSFAVAGHTIANTSLGADYRTLTLTLGEDLTDREEVKVTYHHVKDNAATANLASATVNLTAYAGGVIADVAHVKMGEALVKEGVAGKGEFSVTVKTTLEQLNQTLAEQEGAWKLAVDETGKVHFDVKGLRVSSAPFTNLKKEDKGKADYLVTAGEEVVITAVRETNGSLKLYLNGELHSSAHDKDKVNEELALSTLTIGKAGFAGAIGRFILENVARDFETVVELLDQVSPKAKKAPVLLDAAATTASSHDPNDSGSARPATDAIDRDVNSYWASAPSQNNKTNPQFLTIALKEAQTISEVYYVPRQAAATAVGNLKKGTLEYSMDGQTWAMVPLVDGGSMITFPETTQATAIVFQPVQAKFFRLKATETHHWNASQRDTVMAVAELIPVIEVVPQEVVKPTTAYLRNALARVAELSEADYTADSWAVLQAAATQARPQLTGTDQAAIDAETSKVLQALAGLSKIPHTTSEEMAFHDVPSGVTVVLQAGETLAIKGIRVGHSEGDGQHVPAALVGKDFDLYDIETVDAQGREVDITKPAAVILPVDTGKEIERVVYLPTGDTLEDVLFTTRNVEGKTYLAFEAPHFSHYAIVYRLMTPPVEDQVLPPATPPSNVQPSTDVETSSYKEGAPVVQMGSGKKSEENKATLPQTGEGTSLFLPILGSALLLAGVAFGVKRRQRKD